MPTTSRRRSARAPSTGTMLHSPVYSPRRRSGNSRSRADLYAHPWVCVLDGHVPVARTSRESGGLPKARGEIHHAGQPAQSTGAAPRERDCCRYIRNFQVVKGAKPGHVASRKAFSGSANVFCRQRAYQTSEMTRTTHSTVACYTARPSRSPPPRPRRLSTKPACASVCATFIR